MNNFGSGFGGNAFQNTASFNRPGSQFSRGQGRGLRTNPQQQNRSGNESWNRTPQTSGWQGASSGTPMTQNANNGWQSNQRTPAATGFQSMTGWQNQNQNNWSQGYNSQAPNQATQPQQRPSRPTNSEVAQRSNSRGSFAARPTGQRESGQRASFSGQRGGGSRGNGSNRGVRQQGQSNWGESRATQPSQNQWNNQAGNSQPTFNTTRNQNIAPNNTHTARAGAGAANMKFERPKSSRNRSNPEGASTRGNSETMSNTRPFVTPAFNTSQANPTFTTASPTRSWNAIAHPNQTNWNSQRSNLHTSGTNAWNQPALQTATWNQPTTQAQNTSWNKPATQQTNWNQANQTQSQTNINKDSLRKRSSQGEQGQSTNNSRDSTSRIVTRQGREASNQRRGQSQSRGSSDKGREDRSGGRGRSERNRQDGDREAAQNDSRIERVSKWDRGNRGERGSRGDRGSRGERGSRGDRSNRGDRGIRGDNRGRGEGGDRRGFQQGRGVDNQNKEEEDEQPKISIRERIHKALNHYEEDDEKDEPNKTRSRSRSKSANESSDSGSYSQYSEDGKQSRSEDSRKDHRDNQNGQNSDDEDDGYGDYRNSTAANKPSLKPINNRIRVTNKEKAQELESSLPASRRIVTRAVPAQDISTRIVDERPKPPPPPRISRPAIHLPNSDNLTTRKEGITPQAQRDVTNQLLENINRYKEKRESELLNTKYYVYIQKRKKKMVGAARALYELLFKYETIDIKQAICYSMCPKSQILMAGQGRDVDIFERTELTSGKVINTDFAIKKYTRSSADHLLNVPEELRPPFILSKTIEHILSKIIDDDFREKSLFPAPRDGRSRVEYLDIYLFVSDRIRSIRQDMQILISHCPQIAASKLFIFIYEQIVRFYIISCNELLDTSGFEPKINLEQLSSAFTSLTESYRLARTSLAEFYSKSKG